MVMVGDRFEPAQPCGTDETIEVTGIPAPSETTLVPVVRLRDGLTFTIGLHVLCDPLRWTPSRDTHPTPTPARKLGDGLREIADMLDERETKYGPAVDSLERVAERAGVEPEVVFRVMDAIKTVRDETSPENPDHVRDRIGYLAILAERRRVRGSS